MRRIVFVGAGSMAEALIKGIIKENKIMPEAIYVMNKSDVDQLSRLKDTYQIEIVCPKRRVLQEADLVVLAVKPKDVATACQEIKDFLSRNAVIISVVAGVSTQTLSSLLGERPIARVMPNTSASVGFSASAVCWNNLVTDEQQLIVSDLLQAIGSVKSVNEKDMHIVTALSGSGPAYLYYFAEQFEKAAVQHDLHPKIARDLFIQTMEGAVEMLKTGDAEPNELRRKVTSPGGTTEAGIQQLIQYKVDEAIFACIDAAQNKSRMLGKQYEQ